MVASREDGELVTDVYVASTGGRASLRSASAFGKANLQIDSVGESVCPMQRSLAVVGVKS